MVPGNALQQMLRALHQVSDPGNGKYIEVDRDGLYCSLANASAGSETRILQAPGGPGLRAHLGCILCAAGSIAVTALDSSRAATGTVTFSAPGQWIELVSCELAFGIFSWQAVNDVFQQLFLGGGSPALLPMASDNINAVAAGLSAGRYYRTGFDPDAVCVVHGPESSKTVSSVNPPASPDCTGIYTSLGGVIHGAFYYPREGGGFYLWYNSMSQHWTISAMLGELTDGYWRSPIDGTEGIDAFYVPQGSASGYAVVN